MSRVRSGVTGHLARLMVAFAMVLSVCAQAAAAPDVTNPAVVEAFVDGVVKTNMQQHHSPSGVVAVMKGGEIIFSKGYGFIDVEKRTPVDPATSLFRPGSISKLFTWVSVMQQVERGKLDLDVDVNQYLKTFQIEDTWPGQPVTLRHILTHTGGFEDGGLGYLIIDNPDRIIPLAESLAKSQPVRVNPPGEHTAYSNWATALAGLIVANVSGVPFNDYVQQNIFDVLGMKYASFVEPLPPELDVHMAKAYGYKPDQYTEINYEIISNFGPAGAMAASAHDMTRFARALLNGGADGDNRILKAETLQQILDEGFVHDERVRGMALGFLERRFGPDGFDNFGHDGGTTVFLSHFGLSLQEDFMLFSSFSGPGGGMVHGAFVKAFYDEFFPREITVITPPADFAERAGRYAGTFNSWRSNFSKIESLMRALSGLKVTPLPDNTLMIGPKRYVEVDNNLFRQVDGYERVAFQQDADGKITGLVIDGMGVMQYYRAPFYETAAFTGILVGFSLLVFLGVFLRLGYQWAAYRALQGAEKMAFRASIAVAASNTLFLVFAGVGVSGGMTALMYEIPAVLKFSLIFPVLATLAALWHGVMSVTYWREGFGASVWARVRYSLVSLAALAMAWFYIYWNLLGFNYFS
ncbi:serine hydrolase [Pseudomaricurvus alkylphenolicus]|uniref:serine hydrolase domain-containing protein n=1 Tax=Pseudomaricurvus alkylphenolicus TaxID=1306991 RepID=UPI00141E6B52|nr:serine hydrolase domain-containing protein [Pseudomaricurvus alkylphenolicus]NIB45102.1 serine hydrolase [Pseudomaricurvus alkylphenolicus]